MSMIYSPGLKKEEVEVYVSRFFIKKEVVVLVLIIHNHSVGIIKWWLILDFIIKQTIQYM